MFLGPEANKPLTGIILSGQSYMRTFYRFIEDVLTFALAWLKARCSMLTSPSRSRTAGGNCLVDATVMPRPVRWCPGPSVAPQSWSSLVGPLVPWSSVSARLVVHWSKTRVAKTTRCLVALVLASLSECPSLRRMGLGCLVFDVDVCLWCFSIWSPLIFGSVWGGQALHPPSKRTPAPRNLHYYCCECAAPSTTDVLRLRVTQAPVTYSPIIVCACQKFFVMLCCEHPFIVLWWISPSLTGQ